MTSGRAMEEYVAPELAQLLHRLPHVNASLQPVSAQFNLSSVSYKEVRPGTGEAGVPLGTAWVLWRKIVPDVR